MQSESTDDSSIYNKFSKGLTDEITIVTKSNDVGKNSNGTQSNTDTSDDAFFILSYSEFVDGQNTYSSDCPNQNTEGVTYDFFKGKVNGANTSNSSLKSLCYTRANALPYSATYYDSYSWLRTPAKGYSDSFFRIYSNGSLLYNYQYSGSSYKTYGIVPAFCF